jgi:predicted CoA-binding protein
MIPFRGSAVKATGPGRPEDVPAVSSRVSFPFGENRCSIIRIYIPQEESILMEDGEIDRILGETRTVAVVGLSDKPDRPSHAVARYLKEHGFRIFPVNPNIPEVLGEKAYPSLSALPERVDLVDVFRNPEELPAIASEAVRHGARFFWMQEGVVSERALEILSEAGIPTVMDLCVKKELVRRGR